MLDAPARGRAALSEAAVVHVPIGSGCSIHAGPDGIWYLTVHLRRGSMTIGSARYLEE